MTKKRSNTPREEQYPPLNIPLGQVYVTKEAMELLFQSSVVLDDVLQWHATGYGGDLDYEEYWENYEVAERGGPNLSIHDLEAEEVDGEPLQLRAVTARDRSVTAVSIHTGAD